jgi:hypothetical protein
VGQTRRSGTSDRVLAAVEELWGEYRTAPSVREVMRRVGLHSPSAVAYHQARQVDRGCLELAEPGQDGSLCPRTRRYVPSLARCRELLATPRACG